MNGTVLHAGQATGEILRLDEPLSFWGGFDPVAGVIIDQAHPQCGESLAQRIVAMPGSRGSAGTPGVLGESIRSGTGPAGLIITKADRNLVTGALVAAALYDIACPIVLVDDRTFDGLPNAGVVQLAENGSIQLDETPGAGAPG